MFLGTISFNLDASFLLYYVISFELCMFCRDNKMVLMSQTSPSHAIRTPSHAIRTEVLQFKSGYASLFSGAKNTNAFRHLASNVAFPWNSSKTTRNMRVDAIGERFKRGSKLIVAASPPTEDAVVATEPLTKEDLVGYLASGCKPKENWRFYF